MPSTAIHELNLILGKYANDHPEMNVVLAHDVLDPEPQPKRQRTIGIDYKITDWWYYNTQ